MKNTVPAENQMLGSSVLSFLGEKDAPLKILIVGNSITRHGIKAEIGWNNDFGMAATSEENDYVHRLFTMRQKNGKNVYMRIRQASSWELHLRDANCLKEFKSERAFDADIVIFRLGENVSEENFPYFKDALRDFISYICPNGKTVFSTCFWQNPFLDNAIQETAQVPSCVHR